jgi:hypothetical protein
MLLIARMIANKVSMICRNENMNKEIKINTGIRYIMIAHKRLLNVETKVIFSVK